MVGLDKTFVWFLGGKNEKIKKKKLYVLSEGLSFQNRKEGWFIIEMLEISLRNLDPGCLAGQSLRVPNEERFHWWWLLPGQEGEGRQVPVLSMELLFSTYSALWLVTPDNTFNPERLSKSSFPLFEINGSYWSAKGCWFTLDPQSLLIMALTCLSFLKSLKAGGSWSGQSARVGFCCRALSHIYPWFASPAPWRRDTLWSLSLKSDSVGLFHNSITSQGS